MTEAEGAKLAALRAELSRAGVEGFIVPRADEHLGEYVPACAERLAWLTGFTGSAGIAVVLADRAAVFTDGRYVLQLAEETSFAFWERRHVIEEPPPAWIAAHAPGSVIGYDPMLISEEALARFVDAGITMRALEPNPIDTIWSDRPAPPMTAAVAHPVRFAGRESADKRRDISAILRDAGQDAAILADPASLAWLLNIRGNDVPFTPFTLGFSIIHADASVELFMDPAKLGPATREWLGNGVACAPRSDLPAALAQLAGKRARVDGQGSPAWFAQTLRSAGAEVVNAPDPCLLAKACKNDVERRGFRHAHARDAVAVCRFLHFLAQSAPTGQVTEMSAAAWLLALRGEVEGFRGESFPAISGAGEHGAIIHYRVSDATDRALGRNEVYLIDSGAQYLDGTTDITRTVWTGPDAPPSELRERFTRVLQGHIALATAVFPQGITGAHLDGFARRALWQAGLDYDHGTGHGVGCYLSVHEGPVSLSRTTRPVAIAAGMVLSNEPGFYLPGQYGIRLENLLLVQPAALPDAGNKFLSFETLTLAPFDRRLLAPELLQGDEIAWLNAYHGRVLREVGPYLPSAAAVWLADACSALDAATPINY